MRIPKLVQIIDGVKHCSGCKTHQPASNFYNCSKSSSGKRSNCKQCESLYKTRNKEKLAKYKVEWHQRNKNKTGAQEKKKQNDRNFKRTDSGRYNALRTSAKQRNLELNISKEQYKELIKDFKCHYCESTQMSATGHQLDRKDNNTGYVEGNVVVCCTRCNYIKQDLVEYEEMIFIGKAIKEYRRVKS